VLKAFASSTSPRSSSSSSLSKERRLEIFQKKIISKYKTVIFDSKNTVWGFSVVFFTSLLASKTTPTLLRHQSTRLPTEAAPPLGVYAHNDELALSISIYSAKQRIDYVAN
jgi:hypothetical protein